MEKCIKVVDDTNEERRSDQTKATFEDCAVALDGAVTGTNKDHDTELIIGVDKSLGDDDVAISELSIKHVIESHDTISGDYDGNEGVPRRKREMRMMLAGVMPMMGIHIDETLETEKNAHQYVKPIVPQEVQDEKIIKADIRRKKRYCKKYKITESLCKHIKCFNIATESGFCTEHSIVDSEIV